MSKRIVIVHGWDGGPDRDWMPWAKKELEKRGYEVIIPAMPNPSHPKLDEWIACLKEIVGQVDLKIILIGHSIGCQAILRYLESLPEGEKVGQVICVAGWFKLTGLEPKEELIAKPWFDTPLNFERIKTKADSFVAIFSDNDPYVPYEESSGTYKEKLGAEIILQKGMGHFSQDSGVTELPILSELIEK